MNLAMIGCGAMGAYHAGFATQCGLKLVACGDTVKAKAEALAKQHHAEATVDCLSLCARKDIDVIAICSPTPAHVQYLVAAAQAGKHIFCEKPLARTNEECATALAAVQKSGVKLFVGHVVRFFQEFEAIRAQIAAKKVGVPGFVRTYRGGICPYGEANWYRDYEKSGGVTMDTIIHDFDWIRYTFGDPERVFCQNLRERVKDGIDYSLVTLRMQCGVIVNTIGTWAHPAGFRVRVEICGDNGMIQFDSADAPITSMMRETAGGAPSMIVPSSPVAESPYLLEWRDFVGWLENKHEPRVTPEDGAWAVRMAVAALESSKTEQPVTF